MVELDQAVMQILDLELIMEIREAGALAKFNMIRKQPFSKIRRLADKYWSMDINDLLDLERNAWNKYLSLVDITELTNLIQR